MYRTHNCGNLRLNNSDQNVILCGWVQGVRNLGGMTFVDLRDRYGITQLAFNLETDADLCQKARKLGREDVVRIEGVVNERSSKNADLLTGDIEIVVKTLEILNKAALPPFLIEEETDGGDELRMKYRYLDLRRPNIQQNLIFRHKVAQSVRRFLDKKDFLEIETPFLIKSTPEGARDFVVPSRMHPGQFYALPQSPQTFKQLLMVSGFDRYFQIVRCFRDEDLRADRQPEFTQIDCELSFVNQEDVLQIFEEMLKSVFKDVLSIELPSVERMDYKDALKYYGNDKPDTRFGMKIHELNELVKNKGFKIFDEAELVAGICVEGASSFSRKQIDALTEFIKRPQIGASGLVYAKIDETIKSSVDKFYSKEDLTEWKKEFNAKTGDLILVVAGDKNTTRRALSELRLKLGNELGLRKPNDFKALWVLNFPLLEWDEEAQRYYACHHPFTAPKEEHIELLEKSPEKVYANAYDLVLNGNEIAGGSIRIHNRDLQAKIFEVLGLSEEEANEKFGFLMKAFEYGAPPHGGIAFGFDRLVALMNGFENIRDMIAFPKNNAGRDVMLDSPSNIDQEQWEELKLKPKKD
ncbi:MAG: aspartate--tRNA ligase [Chitinophagaceae bacterium]|nr:MAG: aspartate--tRNA ligase [Chitinophagaceae bacterium]